MKGGMGGGDEIERSDVGWSGRCSEREVVRHYWLVSGLCELFV